MNTVTAMPRAWQNVIDKRCPDCGEKFIGKPPIGYACNTEDCGFFITRKSLGKILMDKEHAAIKYANQEQLSRVKNALDELGIRDII